MEEKDVSEMIAKRDESDAARAKTHRYSTKRLLQLDPPELTARTPVEQTATPAPRPSVALPPVKSVPALLDELARLRPTMTPEELSRLRSIATNSARKVDHRMMKLLLVATVIALLLIAVRP